MADIDEFGLIEACFRPLTLGFAGALTLSDDAALIAPPPGQDFAVTCDMLVAGVHFFADDPPDLIARKAVRVNLSDVAAMGARPHALLLAIALPQSVTEDWLAAFCRGLGEDIRGFQVPLIGGDTVATPGPLTLSITAHGLVAQGRALRRNGARAGEGIWVSGTIGDSALGLQVAQGALGFLREDLREALLERYRLPQPRVTLGPALVGLASAAMDISDGLLQDLGHMARHSGVEMVIDAARLPLSPAASAAVAVDQSLLAQILGGGDDYELAFTVPAAAEESLRQVAAGLGVAITRIGQVTKQGVEGGRVWVQDDLGRDVTPSQLGYRHFRVQSEGREAPRGA